MALTKVIGAGAEGLTLSSTTLTVANGLTLTDGNLEVASGHGVTFGATADEGVSTTTELFDDYEEGTWTPTFRGSTGHPTVTYDIRVGRYVKVGHLVHVQGRVRSDATSGGSGNLNLGDLPFTNIASANAYSTLHIAHCSGWASDHAPSGGHANADSNNYRLITFNSSDPRDVRTDNITTSDLTNGDNKNDLIFSGTYYAQ